MRSSLWILLTCVLLLGLGYFPTKFLGGADALGGMAAGCGVSAISGWASLLLVERLSRRPPGAGLLPAERLMATMAPMIVRLVLVVVGGMAAAWSGLVEPRAVLIWVGISYCALLPVETAFAVRRLGSIRSDHP